MGTQDALYSTYRRWNVHSPMAQEGVVVASDMAQEWLLPWWWEHYHRYNSHPVSFIDLGLSQEMKSWCKQKGLYLHLPIADIFVQEQNEIPSEQVRHWEESYGSHIWSHRNAWFKKPLACLFTPYQKTIWIDLDCEVKKDLQELFSFCDMPSGIAVAREQNLQNNPGGGFNSGVIVFKKGIPLLEEWADLAFQENHSYVGDQDILSMLIETKKIKIAELPPVYNWSRCSPMNPNAIIVHWHGPYGKATIQHQIQKAAMQSFDPKLT